MSQLMVNSNYTDLVFVKVQIDLRVATNIHPGLTCKIKHYQCKCSTVAKLDDTKSIITRQVALLVKTGCYFSTKNVGM